MKKLAYWPPLGIMLPGIGVLIITRILSWLYTPEIYENAVPTISRVASFNPAHHWFEIGMAVSGGFILYFWVIYTPIQLQRLRELPQHCPTTYWLFIASAIFGVSAGIFLPSLGFYSLADSNPVHMFLSFGFFISQLSCILLDAIVFSRLNRLHPSEPEPMYGRHWLASILPILGLVFLALFYMKDWPEYAGSLTLNYWFVGLEYTLAVLMFTYAGLHHGYFRKMVPLVHARA